MGGGLQGRKKKRWHVAAWLAGALIVLATAVIVLMFVFWPFRYRMVHPLLEKEFQSRVEVQRYYRTYFPHPGFVADGVTFWRRGHEGEPPLAQIDHLHVVGTWTGLLFTPHTLYQIWLRGVRVRVVLPQAGKPASGGAGAVTPGARAAPRKGKKQEQSKLRIETIVANGATLDLLRQGKPPLHFVFETMQIHNVRAGEPLTFFTRLRLPRVRAVVAANGTLGPLRPGHYAETPVQGGYSVADLDLRRMSPLRGRASASGQYSGRADQMEVQGKLAIPDFCAGGHVERLDAAYRVTVKVPQEEIDVQNAKVKMAGSTLTANATVAGDPKIAHVNLAAKDGNLEGLLEVVEQETPSVRGKITFAAQAEFGSGAQPFLKRLRLQGKISLDDVTFVQSGTQQKMDAYSARVRKTKNDDPIRVTAAASGDTTFRDGMAYFRDVQVTLPGAKAQLAGTFNLLNTRVKLAGKVEMQQSLSKDVSGWKGWLLTPLDPFFRHGRAGAVVPIAVTGTAQNPKIGENLLHNK